MMLITVQFVMSDRIKDTSKMIRFEKLNPLNSRFELDFNAGPGTFELVSGTTYKFNSLVPLNGQTQTFRIVAQLNDEDSLPSARFDKAISQSAFKKGVVI